MASRGGLVPEGMGERMAFAPGGMVDPNDMQALIASQAQSFGPFSQAGLYGGDKGGGLGAAGYVPSSKLPTPKLITAGAAPQQRPSGLAEAMSAAEKMGDLGSKAAKGYDVGKRGLFGSAATEGTAEKPGKPAERGAIGIGGEYDPKAGYASGIGAGAPADVSDIADKFLRASGGLVPGYAGGGGTNPYEMNADPLQDVLEDQSKNEIEPLKPASAPGGGGGGGGLGEAVKMAGTIASIFSMSDERLKDNIEPVGKLYDGQPVYRYDMGGGPTQIGLMAQEAGLRRPDAVGERDGYMTLDYDRATEDAAGLMPRQGFAGGGGVDDLRQIIIEEAERRGIPPALALRQAQVESSMNPAARGKAGEIGLFQVMPSTARQPGYGVKPVDPAELDDPRRNAGFGLDYLKARAERLGVKDWSNPEETARGLRAYNGGGDPKYVQKILGPGLEGARAYTGDARPASASSAIDQAAPRGGLSAPESAPGKPDNKVLGLSPPNQFGTDKEQSWGDFLTGRQFIVPLLSAVGAAATTPTRNLGTAIAAGLGAGAQAYGGLEKQQADIGKTREESGKIKAEAGEIGAREKKITAETYEKVWIPGKGFFVYDKNKPFEAPKQITDRFMKPLPGVGLNPDEIKTKAGSAEPPNNSAEAAKTTAAPEGTASSATPNTAPATPTQPASAATQKDRIGAAVKWSPTLSVPDDYTPPEQMNITLSPDLAKREADAAIKTVSAQRGRADSAYSQLYRLEEMEKQFKNLPDKGILSPGSYAQQRTAFAKNINTAAQVLGGRPLFSPDDVAAAENLAKDTFRLGADLARSLGDNPAGFIVQRSAQANPGMENTKLAYARIAAGLKEAAKYEQDKAQFFDEYNSKFGHMSGAETMFRKLNPPESYARRAILSTVDPRVIDVLKQYGPDPKLKKQIDSTYGEGITDMLMGK